MTVVRAGLGRLDAAIAGSARHVAGLVLLGLLIYAALVAWSGGGAAIDAMARIGAGWIVLGMLVTLAGFGLRIVRWRMFLAALGPVPGWQHCVVIYMAGIGMTASPGRVGEALRSVFLLQHGVPMGTGMTVTFMDRLSDLIAVAVMAWLAAALASPAVDVTHGKLAWASAALVMALVAVSALLRWATVPLAASRWRAWLLAHRHLAWAGEWLGQGAQAYRQAWRTPLVLPSVALSLLAFGLQALLFAAMVQAVAPQLGVSVAVVIFALGILAGAASMLPGGIGAMDLSLIALLHAQGLGMADATAVTVVLRAVTFWFGLMLGAVALARLGRTADCATRADATAPVGPDGPVGPVGTVRSAEPAPPT